MIPQQRICSIAALVGLLGCSYSADDAPLHGFPSQLEFRLEASSPVPGPSEVIPPAIDLWFNSPPDTESVTRTRIRLFSGLIETRGALSSDLLDSRTSFRPLEPLRQNTRYQLYLNRDLRGLNGATLQKSVVFNFTTAEQRLPLNPAPPAGSAEQIQSSIFTPYCSSCHRSPSPPAQLDLSSASRSLASLVQKTSAQLNRLRLIPGDHTQSYLLFKLLAVGGYLGQPMPPSRERLPAALLRDLISWIDGGAPP